MKTILYATDYSQNSVSALQFAYQFAEKFSAQLIVMHVFDIPIALASPVSITYMNKEKRQFVENREKLKTFCTEHLGGSWENSDINFVVDEDDSVPNGILEKALKFDVNLIVVGSKGASPIKEFFLGSSTKVLIRKAPCPLLAVPANSKVIHLKKMVYATDFEQADIFAINKLVEIAKKFDAEIRVLHITTQKEYAGEEQMEWFKEMLKEKVQYEKMDFDLFFSDTVVAELNWYLNDSEADLLSMLEREEGGLFRKLFHKDVVLKMREEITIPLLSFNAGGL